jgi:DUF1009 family protein
VQWTGIGQLGKMISYFKHEGVEKAMMAGQVKHVQLFSGALPDVRMMKMLWNLPRRNTDALIGGVAEETAKRGHRAYRFYASYYGSTRPCRRSDEAETRRLGTRKYRIRLADRKRDRPARPRANYRCACKGVCGDRSYGRDRRHDTRAGELANGKLTVVKVAKPDQDMRFDVPVIGLPTIETMIEAGATCLSITAGKTLIFDREPCSNEQ